ncbi:uncharacterized protein FFB14_14302 [Fusarium fujikuroi]|nr:uncharacterized protein FFB14_14302 [Fusarium fujikuroi]
MSMQTNLISGPNHSAGRLLQYRLQDQEMSLVIELPSWAGRSMPNHRPATYGPESRA